MSRLLLAVAACLCLAHDAVAQRPASDPSPASGSASPQGASITPGTYDLDIVFGGGTMPGVLVLAARGDSLGATLHVGQHTSPITSVRQKGATLLLAGGGEGMKIDYELLFRGDAVTGTFTYNGERGEVTGRRRR